MAALIARSKEGDRAAFGELYDETFDEVYRYAFALSQNRADAEDITSETYERALRLIRRYEWRDQTIAAWLVRIAQNVAREQARRKRSRPTMPLIEGMDVATADTTAAMDELSEASAAMERLTPAQREVVALRVAGFKVREIAAILGKAEGTIKALQFAGLARLREARDDHS